MDFITIGTSSFRISDIQGFNSKENYLGDYKDRKNNIYFQLEVIIGGKDFFAVREYQDKFSSQEETDKKLQEFHNKWLNKIDKNKDKEKVMI